MTFRSTKKRRDGNGRLSPVRNGAKTMKKSKTESWSGSTEGFEQLPWPSAWPRHGRERDCYFAEHGESIIVQQKGQPHHCFVHFWASPREARCTLCQGEHPRATFEPRGKATHALAFGLFRSPEGPANGERPFWVVCRTCAHRLWVTSERLLDSLDHDA